MGRYEALPLVQAVEGLTLLGSPTLLWEPFMAGWEKVTAAGSGCCVAGSGCCGCVRPAPSPGKP